MGLLHRRPLRHRTDGCEFRAVQHLGACPRACNEPPSESQDGADMHLRGLGCGMVRVPPSAYTLLLICPGGRVKRHFPGRAFLVTNSADIPKILRGFLSTVVDR